MHFLTISSRLLLSALTLGATCYSIIAIYATIRFRRLRRDARHDFLPPVSVLKPLYGADRNLKNNLESFCLQNYPSYEIIFSVRDEADAAVPFVRHIQQSYPSLPITLLFTGRPCYYNAKVHALQEMAKAAAHEILIVSDSDIRVRRNYLESVVAPMADPATGLVTCMSLGVPSTAVPPRLEALGMNTQYVGGILSAWLLMGVKFALGPTMVIRKTELAKLGGFGCLGEYLADDFVLGDRVAAAGFNIVLSNTVPDHLFSGSTIRESLQHRLRWERSSRCSRPAGYIGQIFMHSTPLALLTLVCWRAGNSYALTLAGLCLAARGYLVYEVGWRFLRDATVRRYWWLLPLEDLLSFFVWLWAFTSSEIVWRGAHFRVLEGGKLAPEPAPVIRSRPYTPSLKIAAIGVLLLLLVWTLEAFPKPSLILPLFGIVTASLWQAGLGGGLVSALLSLLGVWYFFLPPLHSFALASATDALRLLLFATTSLCILGLGRLLDIGIPE